MTVHDNENLIRQAIAAQADQAVDPAAVLMRLQQPQQSRRRSFALVAAAGLAVVAAVVAVVVPLAASHKSSAPAAAASSAGTDQNVLLVGLDGAAFTDTVVLARLSAGGTLRAVSLPRDSWVDIPGHGMGKLNSAYAGARQAALDQGSAPAAAEAEGAKSLMATVQALTGVRIDHYAAVDMAGFDSLSTAVGGVEVCLRAATHDRFSGADFPAGRQTLSGHQALAFVRQRVGLPNGDLDRIVRQQAFLRALVTKLVGGNTLRDPKALADLLSVVRANVQVDQSWDLVAFARQIAPNPAVGVATVPTTNGAGGTTLNVDPAAVRTFVDSFLAGNPAGTPEPGNDSAGSPPGDVSCVN